MKFDFDKYKGKTETAIAIIEKWQLGNMYKIPKNTPIDTRILYLESDGNWYPGHFAGFDGEIMFVWDDGRTSFTAKSKTTWEYIQLA